MRLSLFLFTFASLTAPGVENLHWEPVGEPNCGGWVTSIQASPHDSQRLLIGGDMLGAGLSTDGGKSWQATFGFTSWEINDATWHPQDANVVWCGTLMGPHKSSDGGRSWTAKRNGFPKQLQFGYSAPVERVLFDPNDANRLIAIGGSSRGWSLPGPRPLWGAVWESRDGGETWHKLATIGPDGSTDGADQGVNVYGATFAAGSSDTLYAVAPAAGFFVSRDGGKSWKKSNAGLPHGAARRVVAHPSKKDSVFIALGNARPGEQGGWLPGGVCKSSDGGANWISISSGLAQKSNPNEKFTSRYEAFAVSSSHPDVMYAADTAWDGDKIYITKDGGQSWRVSATGRDVRRALPAGLAGTFLSVDPRDPNVAYNGGAEHILATRDGGATWRDIANDEISPGAWRGRGYAGWCSTSVRFNPFRRGQIILQAMDAARVLISDDAMQSWRRPLNKPQPWGGGVDATFTRDGHIYVTTGQHGSFFGIGRSRDGGKTWDVVHGAKHGLPEEGQGKGKSEPGGIFALPDDSQKVWACIGGKLFRTTDGGDSWRGVEIGPDIQWLAGDPKRPQRLFASGSRHVYLTDDGEKWTPLGGPQRAGRLALDAAGRLLVAAPEGGRGGLWRWDGEQPAAQQWTRLWDDRWTWGIAADPSDMQRLALVCNQNPYTELSSATGVWLSADGGATWFQANTGLPMLRGWTIAFNPFNPEELIVGTQGRGFFKTCWSKGLVPPAQRKSYKHSDADTKFAAVTGEPKPTPFRLVIKNGGMTQGEDMPVDWQGKFGDVQVKRDTQTFKAGPASLCVRASGGRSGQSFQSFKGGAGAKFKLAGWIKSQGNVKAQALVQAFAEGYKKNQFIQVKFAQGDSEWSAFEKEVALPEWTSFFNIGLLVEGNGQAWLDEVHDTSVPVDPGTPQSERERMTSGPPPKAMPSEPGWGFYPQFPTAWLAHFESQLARTKQGGVNVIFLGDSITQGWGDAKAGLSVWKERYEPLGAVNYGIGGDSTRQVLWRLTHGLVDGLQPKLVVVKIGTNNLYEDQNSGSDEDIARGIEAVVKTLREKLPQSRVLLLGILPRQNDWFCGRAKRINAIIKKLDDGKNVRFLDLWNLFYDEASTNSHCRVKRELFNKDLLHLEKKGYQVWSDAMQPLFIEMQTK